MILFIGCIFVLGISLTGKIHGETLSVKNNVQKVAPYAPDRRIVVEDPEECPDFSPIGTIEARFPDGTRLRGTGFLIANDIVATAAHNIHSNGHGGSARQITFIPSAGEYEYAPFGRATGTNIRVPNEYINGNTPIGHYDYAAIQLMLF